MAKRLLCFILTMAVCFSTMLTTAPAVLFAEEQPVAKVGSTEYTTIDEAVTAWQAGASTLTLLADVTLSDTILIKSTEHHVLNLGTFTMTAADGKNAIEILPYGTGDAERSALTINADKDAPGGINAGKKACVYYKYATTYTTGNDRPIITVNGGVYSGSTNSFVFGSNVAGFHMVGTAARKCATFIAHGGEFNCSVLQSGKGKMLIYGGTFNATLSSQGDSTCYRLLAGGKFKSIGFMTADTNPDKFAIGSSKGKNDYRVYVDANGYICVYNKSKVDGVNDSEEEAAFIEEVGIVANVIGAADKRSPYLTYSGATTQGVYYVNEDLAYADYKAVKTTGKDISFYGDASLEKFEVSSEVAVDMTKNEVIPTNYIVLTTPESTFALTCKKNEKPAITVTSALPAYEVVENVIASLADEDQIVTYVYSLNKLPVYAKIGTVEYPSLLSAVEAAQAGDVITLLADVTENGFVADKNITLDLGGFTYTINGTVGSAGTETNGLQLLSGNNVTIKNGTITSATAKILVQNYANLTLEGVTLDGASLLGSTPYTLSNNSGNVSINNSTVIASANGVAFDVCEYASYSAPSVSVSNSTITGKIEMSDYNGNEFAGKIVNNSNTYTALGNYVQIGNNILPISDYNITLNVSNSAIQANDQITVEVVIDKDYYSLDYTFTYDSAKFSCDQDVDHDGIIDVYFLTNGTAGVLATYTLKALNDINSVSATSVSVDGEVIQYAVQALTDIVNVVNGDEEQIAISLDYTAETKVDYVSGYTLVLVKGADAGYAYNGIKMFYVEAYGAYAVLVEGAVTAEMIELALTKATNCETISFSYDVNAEFVKDGKVDLKDATAVYACSILDFEVADYMELFLRADVNGDYCVDYVDVNQVTANYTK